MPYASLAQARKFHSDPKLRKYAAEWDAATKAAGGFGHLPYRVPKKTRSAAQQHNALARALATRVPVKFGGQ